jgi:hypothetical protein
MVVASYVSDTSRSLNFRPPSLALSLLGWVHTKQGAPIEIQSAALRASQSTKTWERQHPDREHKQLQLEFVE